MEAINMAAFILNRIGKGRTSRKTLYEIWHNKKIDFEDFKAFKEKVFVHMFSNN